MTCGKPDIIICQDMGELTRKAAAFLTEQASHFIHQKGVFNVVLSGGSTPGPFYRLLTTKPYRDRINWSKVHLFWGDERGVPPVDPASNYGMAQRSLISKITIPPENIHPIKGEKGEAAAGLYEEELAGYFCLEKGVFPTFDLILLGLGDDGHTASIFPGTSTVTETARGVMALYVGKKASMRITLTPPVIHGATNVIFLVSGESKARAVRQTLEGDFHPDKIPAQIVRQAKGKVLFFLDKAAASGLACQSASQ